jgi:hypothetical protein
MPAGVLPKLGDDVGPRPGQQAENHESFSSGKTRYRRCTKGEMGEVCAAKKECKRFKREAG